MSVERDELGRFRPGNRVNPSGRPRMSDAVRLRLALERAGLTPERALELLEAKTHG